LNKQPLQTVSSVGSMMFAQSQTHLMHFLKLTGLPISLVFCCDSNINPHFVLVTVSHIVQQTAASNRFECGFHDVCSKSISFYAFLEIDMSSQFPLFLNSHVNPKVCFSCCKPHRSKNDRFKSLRVWVPLYLL